VATIARVHIAAGRLNPCSSEAVRLGLKKMGRQTSGGQDQAHPLGWQEIKEFIGSAGESLRADRERAMLCVAYETLARRGELVALELQMPERMVARVSGHSTRVGATQDLAALDIDLAALRRRAAGSRRACRCSMRKGSMRRGRGWRAAEMSGRDSIEQLKS
jgi:integrase